MTRTEPRQWRTRAVALIGAVVVCGALVSACSSGNESSSPDMTTHSAMSTSAGGPTTLSAPQTSLNEATRGLWGQHMEWTYAAIAAFAAGSDGFTATAARLLQNQVDIGDAIKPYYGDAVGAELTTLLTAHINGFVAVLKAAKASNTAAYNTAAAAEYANAQDIGDFLAKANPKYWPQADMRQMMKEHIDQTVVYASDQLGGKYADSIAAYAKAESHMLEMADMLTAGIVGAFPAKFAG